MKQINFNSKFICFSPTMKQINFFLSFNSITQQDAHYKKKKLSWEANRFWACQEIPSILWTWIFITTFTRANHQSLSWVRSIQSMPLHPTSWRSILIVYPPIYAWVFPADSFPQVSPHQNLYVPLFTPIYATCPAHVLLNLIIRIIFGEEYRSLSS